MLRLLAFISMAHANKIHTSEFFSHPLQSSFPQVTFIFLTVDIYLKKGATEKPDWKRHLRKLWWWFEKGKEAWAWDLLWVTAALWSTKLPDNTDWQQKITCCSLVLLGTNPTLTNIKSPGSPQVHHPLTWWYKAWEFPMQKRGDERYNSSSSTACVRRHTLNSFDTSFTALYLQHMNSLSL